MAESQNNRFYRYSNGDLTEVDSIASSAEFIFHIEDRLAVKPLSVFNDDISRKFRFQIGSGGNGHSAKEMVMRELIGMVDQPEQFIGNRRVGCSGDDDDGVLLHCIQNIREGGNRLSDQDFPL